MHKKPAKNHERKASSRMTIRRQSSSGFISSDSNNADVDQLHQNCTRVMRSSAAVSWELDTDQSSWSEDQVGEVPARRLIEQWKALESVLYDEENPQLAPGTSLYDECLQWRNQLPHLRLIGRSYDDPAATRTATLTASNGVVASTSNTDASPFGIREKASAQSNSSSALKRDYHQQLSSIRMSELSTHTTPNLRQAKEQVLDYIVDFICKELAEIEAERQIEDQLSENFDEFLKITPAPMCIGKNPLNSNHFHYKLDGLDATETIKDKEARDNDRERELQFGRNKLGTVFNERVIVSPVPFVVTARESFTTLRTTPIHVFKENYPIPSNARSGSKQENTKRKFSLTRKTHFLPRVQAPWNKLVCTAIHPKNVKLTPIDTARLPSSKPRPSKTADSIHMRCSRNSLSPISCSVQPNSPCIHNQNLLEQLEIRGSHIVVQAPSFVNKKKNKRKIAQTNHQENE